MDKHINIEIVNEKESSSLDLRIPNKLTLKEIKSLISPVIFREGLVTNDNYDLKIINKSGFFVLPLQDYAVSDGDVFKIENVGEN